MITTTLGHSIVCTIVVLDQNGNPMLVQPAPDAVPVWTNTTPATETLLTSPDGLTTVANGVAVGTDSIGVSVVIGGATFTASLEVEVDAAPQVVTSVAINAVVSK